MAKPIKFTRSDAGYGWWVDFGKRVRWNSRKATTRMWPRIILGADECCNRAITFHFWPIGHLDIWWEPHWRTFADGPCVDCRLQNIAENCCEWCGSRPCCCEDYGYVKTG